MCRYGDSHTLEMGIGISTLENYLAVSYTVKYRRIHIPDLGIYPSERKAYFITKSAQKNVIATVLIIASNGKQSLQLKCPSIEEVVNKVWHIPMVKCY